MRHAAVFIILVAAGGLTCTRPNPAFDADTTAADPGTTVALTGLSGEPVTSSTTAGTGTTTDGVEPTTGGSSTSAEVGSTGAPVCSKLGEACGVCCGCGVCVDGTCVPDDTQCGPCHTCEQAACVPALAGAACTLPGPDTCSDKLWGLLDGDCFALAPQLGACDDQLACHPQPCEVRGERLVDCDPSCIKDPNECLAGQPAKYDAMKLCEFAGQTKDCSSVCVKDVNGDSTFVSSCHAGLCQQDEQLSCGNYRCRDDLQGCRTDCKFSNDCLPGKICINGACV